MSEIRRSEETENSTKYLVTSGGFFYTAILFIHEIASTTQHSWKSSFEKYSQNVLINAEK